MFTKAQTAMKRMKLPVGTILAALFVFSFLFSNAQELISPEKYFGFYPGSDRNLFDYEELISYLKDLEEKSDKIKLVDIGKSPEGRPMYVAMISDPKNIANLDRLQEINRELALNPNLSKAEVEQMVKEGKVFMLATLSMHASEVGPTQAAPLLAYDLLTTKDPQKLAWMEEVVYMMVPNHNPDGMNMIVNNYKEYKGTKYEGSSLPRVYHKYVGHDNNRDFVILSQEDTKAIAGIYNLNWFPQVMVEKHQMGSTGVRYFVPPPHDPIAQNIDAGIWNWITVFGSNMITDMTKAGQKGVTQHYLFDDYWPGSTETCLWKNVIGMLTEAASVKTATPVFVEENELVVRGKGLSEYKKGINMPDPWFGGWWRLGDIVDYEISSTLSILKTSYLHHDEILRFRNRICKSEVEKGKTEAPFYYIFPKNQRDQSELVGIVHLLNEHGVNVYELKEDVVIENKNYYEGDVVVPLAQAFRPFIKEVLEIQEFPVRHYTPGGEVIKPYDIASWSLPLHRGVKSDEINSSYEVLEGKLSKIGFDYSLNKSKAEKYSSALLNVNNNESFMMAFKAMAEGIEVQRLDAELTYNGVDFPKGSFIISTSKKKNWLETEFSKLKVSPVYIEKEISFTGSKVDNPRIALVETFMHDMDAGWTRFVFDTYGINFTIVNPRDFAKTDFAKNFDVVVFPSVAEGVLMRGEYIRRGQKYPANYPPEFTKGIGSKGFEQLMEFVASGGTVISWGQSIDLFTGSLKMKDENGQIENFQLPFKNIGPSLQKKGLYCPGSLVKIGLTKDHPLTLGMPDELGVFSRGVPVFQTSVPLFDMDRRVIAKFPEKDILMSGYMEKKKLLSNKSAMIWMKKGKGQFVLYGFNPQFRSSTQGAFKLLFNALLLPKL